MSNLINTFTPHIKVAQATFQLGDDYVDVKSKLILGSIHTCVIGVHDLRIWPLKSLEWKVFNSCEGFVCSS